MNAALKAAILASSVQIFNLQQVEQFVNGLLTGLVQDDHLDNVQHCLKDAQTVEKDMAMAIEKATGWKPTMVWHKETSLARPDLTITFIQQCLSPSLNIDTICIGLVP